MEHAKSGLFLQLRMTLGTHPHEQDITYTNRESPAGQHSSGNCRSILLNASSPSSLCSPQDRPMNRRRSVGTRKELDSKAG